MVNPALDVDFRRDALDSLSTYLTIPCQSPDYDPQWAENGQLERAANHLLDWVRARAIAGLEVELRHLEGRTPVLFATIPATGGVTGTVLLYGHFDKQPPLGSWSEGLDPYRPVERDGLLYGRGASDDGYATYASLLAIEALERAQLPHPRCVVLIEGSEESGSPDLAAHVDALSGELGTPDLVLCLDSFSPTFDRLWCTQSLRGNVIIELSVAVLDYGVHSGTASAVVPSSFRILRQLLDRIEDSASGEITVAECHAEVPEAHRVRLEALAAELGDRLAEELPTVPTLTLAGSSGAERLIRQAWSPAMSVTGVGGIPDLSVAGNVLRPSTTVKLSFRLPPTVDAQLAAEAIVAALEADPPQGAAVEARIESAAYGWCCPPPPPWLEAALDEVSLSTFGHPAGWCAEGGTIPFLADLGQRFADVAFVATGVLGPGSNAHGPDESLDLEMVQQITVAMAELLAAHGRAHGGDR